MKQGFAEFEQKPGLRVNLTERRMTETFDRSAASGPIAALAALLKNKNQMKKLLAVSCITCALAMAVQADDTAPQKSGKAKSTVTAEQKALRKEITAKYDTNKDGKLDKEERAKISAEDKEKMEKAGLGAKKKKAQ